MLVDTTRSFGNGSEDIYLVNLDSNYQLEFFSTLGFLHRDVIRSIIPVNGGWICHGLGSMGLWDGME